MSRSYKWGIISTGKIANHFALGLSSLDSAEIYAVGSRSKKTARAFAEKWSIKKAYSSYEALYRDEDIDIVYIGTPHSFHYQNTLDALNAGKHVLCEKAFALNAHQAVEMANLATQKGLFLMDAMWNRFQPWYATVRKIINSGTLGELLHFKANLSFKFEFDPRHRLFNPDLGGGALLDLGVYPIALASAFMGQPLQVQSTVHKCPTGVDDQVSVLFGYANGATAELACSSRYTSNSNPTLYGSRGALEIQGIVRPDKVTLTRDDNTSTSIETPCVGNAYQYEAQAVMDMLDQGRLQHPRMPLDETIAILQTMDQIREAAGISYPGEK